MKYAATLLVIAMTGAGASAEALEEARARWRDPEVLQRINDGIERNRKGDVLVQVLDSAGNPVANAQVSATQVSHAFLFGCNLFVLHQLDTPELNKMYEQRFTEIFNFASLPFYWKDLEPQPGALRLDESAPHIWRRPPPDVLLKWCKAHGITPKGHPLLWHSINPDWMPTDPDALHAAYIKRFRELAERYAAEIPIWDVVNESLVCKQDYPLYTPDRAYVTWAFEQAHAIFPAPNLLMINEVMTVSHEPLARNRYFTQVQGLLKAGVGVEGIGFQFHYFDRGALDKVFFGNPAMEPRNLLDLYEGFETFDRPLYITEITIPGSGADGPALQQEVVANLYRLWFSTKSMAGITWWNLGDKCAYGTEDRAMGGLLDENMDPKPAYEALDKLINHEWKTTFKGVTGADGRCTFRGFAGDYTVHVRVAAPGGVAWRADARVESGKQNEWKLTP